MAHVTSPTASTASGSTTNPNTPRSCELLAEDAQAEDAQAEDSQAEDAQAEDSQAEDAQAEDSQADDSQAEEQDVATGNQAAAVDVAHSSPESSPGGRFCDIQPTWPKTIDRTRLNAQVCWLDQTLDNIRLDIHWTGEHDRAFVKLYTVLHLEGAPGASRQDLINAYIFIYPERICQLSFTSQPQHEPFGPPTVALTFDLSRPPALILPGTYTAFGPGAESTMLSLRRLVRQTCFTVFASIPERVLSSSWLQRFCRDISDHKYTTIASLANLKPLYQGHDAQVVEGDALPETVSGEGEAAAPAAQALPVYQEAQPSSTPPSTKRKRSDDGSSATDHDFALTGLAAMLDSRFAAHERRVGAMLSAHEDKLSEMLSAHLGKVDEQLVGMEDRVRNDVEDKFTDSLNTMVQEGMDEVQESVMAQITSMPLKAYLAFPDHPVFS
ncbi:hypothetical protein ACQKWADRAFT_306398 [Trichoderma austrokoningii]